jgi:hypothetical protein
MTALCVTKYSLDYLNSPSVGRFHYSVDESIGKYIASLIPESRPKLDSFTVPEMHGIDRLSNIREVHQ